MFNSCSIIALSTLARRRGAPVSAISRAQVAAHSGLATVVVKQESLSQPPIDVIDAGFDSLGRGSRNREYHIPDCSRTELFLTCRIPRGVDSLITCLTIAVHRNPDNVLHTSLNRPPKSETVSTRLYAVCWFKLFVCVTRDLRSLVNHRLQH